MPLCRAEFVPLGKQTPWSRIQGIPLWRARAESVSGCADSIGELNPVFDRTLQSVAAPKLLNGACGSFHAAILLAAHPLTRRLKQVRFNI
jgi:hypothetical protein